MGILDDYDEGEYYLDGRLIRGLNETQAAAARNRMIGFIFQSFNLINYKNAMENVRCPSTTRESRGANATPSHSNCSTNWASGSGARTCPTRCPEARSSG